MSEPGYVQDVAQVLPHDLTAERAVLCAMLVRNDVVGELADVLTATHFYRAAHRHIYAACLALDVAQQPIDLITVTEHLGRAGTLEEVGGPAYVAALIDGTGKSLHARAYADIVVRKWKQRQVIAIANKVRTMAYGEDLPAEELVEAERLFTEMAVAERQGGFVMAEQWMAETTALIMTLGDQKRLVTGVPTDFADLDYMTRGFQPGDLIILGGRPSMGKTAIAQQIAISAAAPEEGAVALFSLEMSRQALGLRAAALAGRVSSYRILAGKLDAFDFESLVTGLNVIAGTSLAIDDTPALTLPQMRSRCRRLAMQMPVRLIVVDYLQLMQAPKAENRQIELSILSRGLKQIARELDVPLLALSQLSRAPEARVDKRPQLSDLRESGSLEQDADVVLLMFRPEYYEREPTNPGLAEVIIAKQRNGPTGPVKLKFIKDQTRFERWVDQS